MVKFKEVGRSSRTPYKHFILNSELGRQSGIISKRKVPFLRPNPFLIVDLCAGDGSISEEHDSSPRIILKHAEYAHEHGISVDVNLYEKAPHTVSLLRSNLVELPSYASIIEGDSSNFTLHPTSSYQPIFVFCDPNNIHQLPLTSAFLESTTKFTTYIITLGCNVGGLKKLALKDRKLWFEHVRSVTSALPSNHDSLLVGLTGDSDRWAYLVTLPRKWASDSASRYIKKADYYKKLQAKGFSKGARVESFRESPSGFSDLCNWLFLTLNEYNRNT